MANVRLANPEEAHQLPAIERSAGELFRQWPPLAWIADDRVLSEEDHLAFIREGLSWIAVDSNDQPVGFICVEKIADCAHIHQLAVSLDHQGHQLGHALVQQVIDWAEQQRLNMLTLTTFRKPPWNAPWYQKIGFQPIPEDELDQRLQRILQIEAEHDMPLDQRVAMSLYLNRK